MAKTRREHIQSMFAIPLCRDTVCMPYGRKEDKIYDLITTLIQMMFFNKDYLMAFFTGMTYMPKSMSWKEFADKVGINDDFDFLYGEFIKFIRNKGSRTFSGLFEHIFIQHDGETMRDDKILKVISIDFHEGKGSLSLFDVIRKQEYRYDIPENISTNSTEKIGSLNTTWGTLAKAIAVVFLMDIKRNIDYPFPILNKALLSKHDEVVFECYSDYKVNGVNARMQGMNITVREDNITIIISLLQGGNTIYEISDKHGEDRFINSLDIRFYMTSVKDIYLGIMFRIEHYKLLDEDNYMSYHILIQRSYYHPLAKLVIFDLEKVQIEVEAEAHRGGVKVFLGGNLWFGVSKWRFRRKNRLVFSLYANTTKKTNNWRMLKGGSLSRIIDETTEGFANTSILDVMKLLGIT